MTKYNRGTSRSGRAGRKVETILPAARRREWKEVIMEERYYDLVFIVRPATPEDEIKKVLTVIEHTVAEKAARSRRRSTGAPESLPIAWPSTAKASTFTRKSARTTAN